MRSSTPSLTEFDPHNVPWQVKPIQDVRMNFDYTLGVHELLMSGSVGSAKSILGAHLGVTHCLLYPRARLCLGRRSLPDLKDTIFQKILEHLEGDLVDGKDYWVNTTRAGIKFRNGSEIISRSWADKKYKKMRSLELSAAIIEELTENDENDREAIQEISMRVGRLPHIKENWIAYMTNPDDPEHWVHRDYIDVGDNPLRHVYYSITSDNKYLPPSYIERLKKNLDPKTAQRMLFGKWVAIDGSGIYHAYRKEIHFKDKKYEINPRFPIHIAFDFNIGEGKPMSAVLFQFISDHFHFFGELVIEGARTLDILEEAGEKGYLEHDTMYFINGDASGKHSDTRSKKSDYDIIKEFLAKFETKSGRKIRFTMDVPLSNPPIRKRHNLVNGYLENMLGEVRTSVYAECSTLDKGLRLTKMKNDALEDDSKPYQHITTAAGYGMIAATKEKPKGRAGLI